MSAPGAERAREAIARAREASRRLRERPIAELVATVGRVLDVLRDPASAPRRRLESELPGATGFSPEIVRAGLALALERWTSDALRGLVRRELGDAVPLAASTAATSGSAPQAAERAPAGRAGHAAGAARATLARGLDVTSVLLGGALPMPAILDLLLPLAVGSAVVAKPGRHDPVTAGVVHDAVRALDADLADALQIVSLSDHDDAALDALLDADAVVVTGSDATLDALRPRVRAPRRFVGRGHRISLAVVGASALEGADGDALVRALARDVALWDQLGCLSPISIHVLAAAHAEEAASALGERLARALDELATRWPRGRLAAADAATFSHARAEAEMRAATGAATRVLGPASLDHCVVVERGAAPRPSPLHRFVRVHPATSAPALLDALRAHDGRLAGVACAGLGPEHERLAAGLARLGASRICAPGRLQAPPLDWHHEGQPVLSPLVRFTDLET